MGGQNSQQITKQSTLEATPPAGLPAIDKLDYFCSLRFNIGVRTARSQN